MPTFEHNSNDEPSRHEPDTFHAWRVALRFLALAAFVPATMLLLSFFRRPTVRETSPASTGPATSSLIRNAAKLDPDLPAQLRRLRAKEQSELQTYGWIDRERRIAQIPIDQAMRLLADHPELMTPPRTPVEAKRPRKEDR